MSLTDRQRREIEFYEEFSARTAPSEIRFDAVLGKERRPWNSYWYLIERVKENFRTPGQTLLDFGCGAGTHSLLFARVGYDVSGFDISPNNISVAKSLARKYGLEDRTHFTVGAAETLNYPDEFFDVIVGTDILHHVNIRPALTECFRVLKRGGMAIFHEPIRVPAFDALRESALGRRIVTKEKSIERHVTEDERKLDDSDVETLRSFDPDLTVRRFMLTSRLSRFVESSNNSGPSHLERLDARLFQLLPFLKSFGGVMVITLRK